MTETALELLEYLNEQDRPVRILGRDDDIASLQYKGYIKETQLRCYGITPAGKHHLRNKNKPVVRYKYKPPTNWEKKKYLWQVIAAIVGILVLVVAVLKLWLEQSGKQ